MSKIDFNKYETDGFYDEMMDENGNVRPHYKLFSERIKKVGWKKLNYLQYSTDRAQLSLGMTFNVYSDNQGIYFKESHGFEAAAMTSKSGRRIPSSPVRAAGYTGAGTESAA